MKLTGSPRRSAIAAAVICASLAAGDAAATTYTITTLAFDLVDNGNCTLAEALAAAAGNTPRDTCPAGTADDTVVLQAAGTYPMAGGAVSVSVDKLTLRGDRALPDSSYVLDLGDSNRLLDVGGNAEVTLENLRVVDGRAPAGANGGAVQVVNAGFAARDVTFEGNTAQFAGALLFNGDDHALRLERVRFVNNTATTTGSQQTSGGAAVLQANGAGSITLLDCLFLGNRAQQGTASAYYGAFAVYGFGVDSQVTLRQLEVRDNVSDGATTSGSNAYVSIAGSLLLEDALFVDNSITSAIVTGATVGLDLGVGGPGALAEVRRLRFVRNRGTVSPVRGLQAQLAAGSGGELRVHDVLVADGSARGIYLDAQNSATLTAGHLTVTGHSEYGLYADEYSGSTTRVESSLSWNNGTNFYDGGTAVDSDVSTNRNIWAFDPLFANPAAGDYRLTAGSPARDGGNPAFVTVTAFDANHADRTIGAAPDIGAFEYDGLFSWNGEEGDLVAWSQTQPLE